MARTTNRTVKHDAHVEAFLALSAEDKAIEAVGFVPSTEITGERYVLSSKAQAVRTQATLQGAHLKAGKDWRKAGFTAVNTRVAVVDTLAALQELTECAFTMSQALSALAELHAAKHLGSGTPRSYVKAFIANGYLEEA